MRHTKQVDFRIKEATYNRYNKQVEMRRRETEIWKREV